MMKKGFYIILICILASVSCTKEDIASRGRISLRAGIYESTVISKAATSNNPFKNNTPSQNNPLEAAVWFSTSNNNFANNPVAPTYLPCRTSILFTSEAASYASTGENDLKYPTDDSKVYCLGLYPKSGWESEDNINISHDINGIDDLMFADVIEGSWNSHFQSQTYNHLLTWIKLSVCAMTTETAAHWGKIKSISVSSKSKLNINLNEAGENRITYSGEQNIIAYQDDTGMELSLTSQEAGSIFCSPSKTYTVSIVTDKDITKTIDINLSDLNYEPLESDSQAKGKLFVLSLYFTPFNVIEGACTLNYWNDQSEDLYLQ